MYEIKTISGYRKLHVSPAGGKAEPRAKSMQRSIASYATSQATKAVRAALLPLIDSLVGQAILNSVELTALRKATDHEDSVYRTLDCRDTR